jgi:hypothetical protein
MASCLVRSAKGTDGQANLPTTCPTAGASWSEPKIIYNPGSNNQTIGNQIVVGPDGTLFNFFDEILNFRNDDHGPQFDLNLSMIRSTDQGTTWLPSGRPIRIADMNGILIRDPDQPTAPGARDRHRAADLNPDVAVDAKNGNLYAVWQDARFSGLVYNDIAFTMSTNGGQTWSTPIKVNQTPDSAAGHNGRAFTPSVHVLPNGTIGVRYYVRPSLLVADWAIRGPRPTSDAVVSSGCTATYSTFGCMASGVRGRLTGRRPSFIHTGQCAIPSTRVSPWG